MYLKALEIQGFKSFPDKTVLQLRRAISRPSSGRTAAANRISPTPSAGSWASRASAAARREDGGRDLRRHGEARQPWALREATLVLDNRPSTCFPPATSRRSPSRGGTTAPARREYYINRRVGASARTSTSCFMDTGLGREGYSNIGQGKIDEILSLKSGDRREVFEEAAGISQIPPPQGGNRAQARQRTQDNLAAHRRQDRRAGAAGRAAAQTGGDGEEIPRPARRARRAWRFPSGSRTCRRSRPAR